jgi:hypothetical protein
MTAAILGLLPPIFGALVHAVVFRWLPERVRLLSLPIFDIAALVAAGLAVIAGGRAVTAEEWLVGLVLTLSLGFAYALLFLGVLHDSPTLALVNAIEDGGLNGMPVDGVSVFAERHPFVRSRLVALIASGILVDRGGLVIYRGRVDLLLHLSDLYRRLCRNEMISG